jgi:endonuclease YncB( thermonuclease family)
MQSISESRLAMRSLFVIALFVCSTPGWCDEVLIGKVVRVVDGDTLVLLDSENTQHRVRLAGIDTPESRGGQPYWRAAKDFLSEKTEGKSATILWNELDRYDRIVGKVICMEIDINFELVANGLAWHYKFYADEQSEEDRSRYSAAEEIARRERLGLWQEPKPTSPWDWRRQGYASE